MKISGGLTEDGIVVGNAYDKYGTRNPVARWIMQGFESALSGLVQKVSPSTIHEIGCGEGYWVMRWKSEGLDARGCDFSTQVIALAQENAVARGLSADLFEARSIYDLEADRDGADLVICCEVMEHLEHPEQALKALQRVVKRNLILSVPREPIWCMMNLARGSYVRHWGNTPGHIQHWSRSAFIKLVSAHFQVVEVKTPLPWTMLLCRPLP